MYIEETQPTAGSPWVQVQWFLNGKMIISLDIQWAKEITMLNNFVIYKEICTYVFSVSLASAI
jgi:hypothetical protein